MAHVEYLCPECGGRILTARAPISDVSHHPLQKYLCPDCRKLVPWYDLKRVGRVRLEGVGPPASAAPILRETVYATGGREVLVQNDFGDDTIVEESASNTAAGTHDGSDLTLDSAHWLDGAFLAGSGHVEVIYSLDPITYSGLISFTRWHLRAWFEELAGTAYTRQISAIWTAAGFVATNTVATRSMTGINTPTDLSLDSALSPLTGQPWTATELNGRKFGFQLDHFIQSGIGVGTEALMHASEFWIEVWG